MAHKGKEIRLRPGALRRLNETLPAGWEAIPLNKGPGVSYGPMAYECPHGAHHTHGHTLYCDKCLADEGLTDKEIDENILKGRPTHWAAG